jgi:hypothetical protein
MAKPASYKVVTVHSSQVEKDINDLADKGWKVVSAVNCVGPEYVLVILENPSASTERQMLNR